MLTDARREQVRVTLAAAAFQLDGSTSTPMGQRAAFYVDVAYDLLRAAEKLWRENEELRRQLDAAGERQPAVAG